MKLDNLQLFLDVYREEMFYKDMRKIVIAPDSFKGTMSAKRVAEIVTEGIRKYDSEAKIVSLPIADGGEGTLDILCEELKGHVITCQVHNPLFEFIEAKYLLVDDIAFIELAQGAGLTLIETDKQNPLYTTTYGVGELIVDALNHNISRLFLTIGGSATNDGGMGALSALGAHFYDCNHKELTGIGQDLKQVQTIDLSQIDKRLASVTITILCDVDNPLCGENGATYTYGPQKGGTPEILDELEAGMKHYACLLEQKTNTIVTNLQGSGAAGGFSVPFIALYQAQLTPGIQTILELIDFEHLIHDADLVITGEGRIDFQSAHGKVLYGIGKICQKNNIDCIAIGGCLGKGYEAVFDIGIKEVITTSSQNIPFEEMKRSCEENLRVAVEQWCQKHIN